MSTCSRRAQLVACEKSHLRAPPLSGDCDERAEDHSRAERASARGMHSRSSESLGCTAPHPAARRVRGTKPSTGCGGVGGFFCVRSAPSRAGSLAIRSRRGLILRSNTRAWTGECVGHAAGRPCAATAAHAAAASFRSGSANFVASQHLRMRLSRFALAERRIRCDTIRNIYSGGKSWICDVRRLQLVSCPSHSLEPRRARQRVSGSRRT